MDQQVKKLWLEALRSGEYMQTTGELRNGAGFCCLGVLCDLHAKQTGKGHWKDDAYFSASAGDSGVPVDAVRDWAGLPTNEGHIWDDKHCLSELNDAGADFDLIAAIIEHEL
jgi:hypothetical protein